MKRESVWESNLSYLKPPIVRPHIVAHSSQKTDVPHRRPVDVVEWSVLKRLELLEFIFTRPTLQNNQSRGYLAELAPGAYDYLIQHHQPCQEWHAPSGPSKTRTFIV